MVASNGHTVVRIQIKTQVLNTIDIISLVSQLLELVWLCSVLVKPCGAPGSV